MNARRFVGLIVMLAAVIFGLWAGVWWAFIGGIVQIIHAVQMAPVDAVAVAVGALRILAASFIGVVAFMAVGSVGAVLVSA